MALVVADHDHHDVVVEAVGGRELGLAGHAAFESYSVLTRMPPPLRRTPAAALRLLTENFPGSHYLPADRAAELIATLPGLGVAGGAVYDALVGAAAVEHGLPLATRDRRATDTYRSLDVEIVLVE